MDGRMDGPSYRDARMHLKIGLDSFERIFQELSRPHEFQTNHPGIYIVIE